MRNDAVFIIEVEENRTASAELHGPQLQPSRTWKYTIRVIVSSERRPSPELRQSEMSILLDEGQMPSGFMFQKAARARAK